MARRKRKQVEDSAADGADSARNTKITPGKAKNAIAVLKIVGPAVVPVVAPYVLKTVGQIRDRVDRMRARRLGVPVEELPAYSGKGGLLHARISGAANAVAELRNRPNADGDHTDHTDQAFLDQSETTLRQLTAAVRAAERMPAARRKAAHRAAAAELDRLEEQLLHRLGLQS